MRRLLAIALLCLLPLPAFASFGAATAWDIQTTGANTNGGGFDSGVASPGTDESMGSGTACTITTASSTTGTGSCTFSATTHGPGNFFYIASGTGCVTGRHEMSSQVSGTGTFESSISDTSGRSCVGIIGGSTSTMANAISSGVSGNTFWVQTGTYTITSTLVFTYSMGLVGYHTAHGDCDGVFPLCAGNAPLITTATNSTPLLEPNANGTYIFRNLSLSNTASTRAEGIYIPGASAEVQATSLKLDGFTTALYGGNRFDPLYAVALEVEHWTVQGLYESHTGGNGNVYISDSWFHDASAGTGAAMNFASTTAVMVNRTIVTGSLGVGIQLCSCLSNFITSSTIAANAGDNVNGGSNADLTIENTILYGSTGGYGLNMNPLVYAGVNNAFGGNSLGAVHSGVTVGYNAVTLTSSPFTSSTNFALNNTAGGGAAAKAAGYPGIFPGGLTQGYLDQGAVQSQSSSSGGSGAFAYTQ